MTMTRLCNCLRIEWHWLRHRWGIVIPCLGILICILESISPLTWIKRRFQYHFTVEVYVLATLVIAIIFTLLLWKYDSLASSYPFRVFICAILIWRLSDILQAWLKIFLVGRAEVASPSRSVILTLINYIEIAIIFGIIAFANEDFFTPTFGSILNSLRYSFNTILPVIPIDQTFIPHYCLGNVIFYSEIAFELLFILVIIQRVLSLFRES